MHADLSFQTGFKDFGLIELVKEARYVKRASKIFCYLMKILYKMFEEPESRYLNLLQKNHVNIKHYPSHLDVLCFTGFCWVL